MRSFGRPFLITAVVVALVAGLPMPAMADMEGRMPFTHVRYESSGLENSGAIKVDVFQDARGVSSLEILAFGSMYSIVKSQLGAIDGYEFNSIGVSYSKGYSNVGGRTIYVLLHQAFSSGSKTAAMVVVREHGKPEVIVLKLPPSTK